jgi:ClpP class serine protease
MVGNVGTILCGVDSSANWAQQGLKLELFTSSPLKATGVAGKPWTEADRAYLTERMLQADARIKAAVRSGRPQICTSPPSMAAGSSPKTASPSASLTPSLPISKKLSPLSSV